MKYSIIDRSTLVLIKTRSSHSVSGVIPLQLHQSSDSASSFVFQLYPSAVSYSDVKIAPKILTLKMIIACRFATVAVVGLEETLYHVTEGVGVVEVCAIVYNPVIDCPVAFPFNISLSTSGETK